MKTKHGQF